MIAIDSIEQRGLIRNDDGAGDQRRLDDIAILVGNVADQANRNLRRFWNLDEKLLSIMNDIHQKECRLG